jgi:hypothetical protein
MANIDQKVIEPGAPLEVLRLWIEGELARSTHELRELLTLSIGQGTAEWVDACLDTLDDISAADAHLKMLDRYI